MQLIDYFEPRLIDETVVIPVPFATVLRAVSRYALTSLKPVYPYRRSNGFLDLQLFYGKNGYFRVRVPDREFAPQRFITFSDYIQSLSRTAFESDPQHRWQTVPPPKIDPCVAPRPRRGAVRRHQRCRR